MAEAGKQEIRCSVDSCRFNDHTQYCTLSNIMVGSDSTAGEAHNKRETECVSFESQ